MDNIISYILQKASRNKNYLVGIDGGAGAGKTTIVNALKSSLQKAGFEVQVLHIDDFIHLRNIRYNDLYEEWYCYYNLQWRYEYLIKEILQPAKNNENLVKEIELYNKEFDRYDMHQLSIKPGTIILLEGVFLQREELRGLFDFIVYIDVPRIERLDRVLKRDTYIGDEAEIKSKYERRYFVAEDYYMNKCNPIENAHIVIR